MLNQKFKPDEESVLLEYIEKLENQFKIDAAIVFGSITKGKSNYKSNIDLLIISDHMVENWFELHQKAYSLLKGKIQPFVITTNEFLNALKNRQTIIWEALADGIIVCDDTGITKAVMKQFHDLIDESALKRMNKGWNILKPELIDEFTFRIVLD